MALMLCRAIFEFVCDVVRSAMPEITPEKAAAELEHAKQSLTKITDNRKATKPDTETAYAREHVSMLRCIGPGSGGAAFA